MTVFEFTANVERGGAIVGAKDNKCFLFLFSGVDHAALLKALKLYAGSCPSTPPDCMACESVIVSQKVQQGKRRLAILAHSYDELLSKLARAQKLVLLGRPVRLGGIYYCPEACIGETAFVYTGGAGSYPGNGSGLLESYPELTPGLVENYGSVDELLEHSGASSKENTALEWKNDLVSQLWATISLMMIHTEFTQGLIQLRPDAAIGFSSGETGAFFCNRVWRDPVEMRGQCSKSSIFNNSNFFVRRYWRNHNMLDEAALDSSNIWSNWVVMASPQEVKLAIGDNPLVHLTTIHHDHECGIGGYPQACDEVLTRLGAASFPLSYAMVNHCPEVQAVGEEYRQLHVRKTYENTKTRFYSNGFGTHFQPNAESAADSRYRDACRQLNFPNQVRQAYQDGVRTFIEHGPRDFCTRLIKEILKDKNITAVAMDRSGKTATDQVDCLVAELYASGVDLDLNQYLMACQRHLHIATSAAVTQSAVESGGISAL